jgi:hypothetical protein
VLEVVCALLRTVRAPVSDPVVEFVPHLLPALEESLLEGVDAVEALRWESLVLTGLRHVGS